VALLVGASQHISPNLFGPGDTLASIIANQFNEATGIQRAALIGMGVVLLVLTVAVGMLARGIVNRYDRHSGAVA
jgi:phosphate transport system permease protein